MLQVASQEERYYTENNVYGSMTAIGYAASSILSQSGRHNITLTTANADSTYIISATPLAADTTCGALTLTNTGVTGSAIAGACW
jgi:type IV pilus assembly protein PilE